jgi:uncharacterized protein (TIGR02391 family)
MDISKQLQEELWESIKKSYLSEDYTTAILTSIAYLRDIIREKSNLELDGIDLINQAFSEKKPKIAVSKMETKNDINIQKGLRELLSGIYTHIRNPRSHDKYKDSKENAIAIILFVNYLLNIIDKSKISFSSEKFISQVYDDFFHPTKEYGKLLIDEIPRKQVEDIFYKLYASIDNHISMNEPNYHAYYEGWEAEEIQNNDKRIKALQIVLSLLITKLPNLRNNIFQKISDDLIDLSSNNTIHLFAKIIIFMQYWSELFKRTRLRTLQFLIRINIENDKVLEYYQTKSLLLGWTYFDDEEKKIVQDNLSIIDFSIKDNKLIRNTEEKKIIPYSYPPTQTIPNIDVDDEIPF